MISMHPAITLQCDRGSRAYRDDHMYAVVAVVVNIATLFGCGFRIDAHQAGASQYGVKGGQYLSQVEAILKYA